MGGWVVIHPLFLKRRVELTIETAFWQPFWGERWVSSGLVTKKRRVNSKDLITKKKINLKKFKNYASEM